MFKAVLFDLDGTLLNIDMSEFLPCYFVAFKEYAIENGYGDGSQLIRQILNSTSVMIKDLNPDLSNEEVFMNDFFKDWPYSQEETYRFFESFYARCFPRLSVYSAVFEGNGRMIKHLTARNIKVVVATNPVFPKQAITERIKWAGLDSGDFSFITSYENMHFCKPHCGYYQEIAYHIGVKPEDCLMIGNDRGEDLPAGQIGMKTFLVEDMLIDNGCDLKPDWQGSLTDLHDFLIRICE